jgi:outer membrane protein TolC
MLRNKIINTIIIPVLLGASVMANANSVHLNLEKEADSVLDQKTYGVNLETIKELVVGEGVDVRIAYQRVLQAQKEISVARAQFFPYGTGLIFNYNSYAVWNTLILVELITSLPTKFYNVRESKNLSTAQVYQLAALKENLKNEIAKIYFGVLKQEAIIKLVELELKLLEKLYVTTNDRVSLGLSTGNDLLEVEQRNLALRDDLLKFKAYHIREKKAFNNILSKNPREGSLISLQPVKELLNEEKVGLSTSEMINLATSKSPEIKASKFLISAAFNHKRSSQWSILSFSGIGFGYWGRVSISKSKVREMELLSQRTKDSVVNNVYTKESEFENSVNYLKSQMGILTETKSFMELSRELFKTGEVALDVLLEAQIVYLKDYRETVMANYSALASYDSLERAVLTELSNINPDTSAFVAATVDNKAELATNLNGRRLRIWIENSSNEAIKKVVYDFDGNSLRDMTSTYSKNKYLIKIKTRRNFQTISGTYSIYYQDGSVQNSKFVIK